MAWLLDRLLGRLARQGVLYAEIRVSPSVWECHGLPAEETFEGLMAACSRPGPVRVQFIVDGVRQWDQKLLARDLDLAARFSGRGVAAFGLGGDEAAARASGFRALAAECRSLGLPLVPHAGEACGPDEVADALDVFSPPRIAHGIAAARDPGLLRELAGRGTHLEVAPTSNLRTQVVSGPSRHPLRTLWAAGVPLSLGTDDPALFGTTLCRELRWAEKYAGWKEEDAARSQLMAARAALLPEGEREGLARAVGEGWGR